VIALDPVDHRILGVLQEEGRIPIAELAERVGLSVSPCWRRVRQMEEWGVILGYAARVDPAALGIGFTAFVLVSIDLHKAPEFEASLLGRGEVVECHAIAGDQDYLLHVKVADMEAFDRFLRAELIKMPGVERMRTSFALKAIKPAQRPAPGKAS